MTGAGSWRVWQGDVECCGEGIRRVVNASEFGGAVNGRGARSLTGSASPVAGSRSPLLASGSSVTVVASEGKWPFLAMISVVLLPA